MNLYEIYFCHFSQKDSDNGIKEYFVASNDEDVFNHINKKFVYEGWTDREDIYCYEQDKEIPYKDFVLEHKGDIEDESLFDDLYYGITTYGWELIKENISEQEITTLIELNIVTPQPTAKE